MIKLKIPRTTWIILVVSLLLARGVLEQEIPSMKAENIENLLDFIHQQLFYHGRLVAISEKGSESIYTRVNNVDSDRLEIQTSSYESIHVDNVYSIILFEYDELGVPDDIRDLLKLINKTNKEYDKFERLEQSKTVTAFIDCEGEPLFVEDFDLESIERLARDCQLVKYSQLTEKEITNVSTNL